MIQLEYNNVSICLCLPRILSLSVNDAFVSVINLSRHMQILIIALVSCMGMIGVVTCY